MTGRGPREHVAGVARVLSPHGAFALHRVDGAFPFALRSAVAMALPTLPLVLSGRATDSVFAMMGTFTTAFGRNLPYTRRARVLAVVACAMTACVGAGSALAAWVQPRENAAGAAVVVAAMAVVAGLAKFACDAARLGGLGAVLLLFSFAVSANGTPAIGDVLPHTGLAAVGAVVAWALAISGRLVQPDRPQRLAVATALRELAALLEAAGAQGGGPAPRQHATAAVVQAYQSLGVLPPTAAERGGRADVCVILADFSWSLLIDSAHRPEAAPAGLPRHLRRQIRVLVDWRRRTPALVAELTFLSPGDRGGPRSGATAIGPGAPATGRATELLMGRQSDGRGRLLTLAVPALRMGLGAGVAGGLSLALGLGHGYWAAIAAAAVLHSVNVRMAAQRAVQRTFGTVAGLLLAFGVLAAGPTPTVLVLVIVLLEFLLEYFVVRNYGLGVVFLTPLALLLTDLADPEPAGVLVADRALSSLLGITIGLVCALLVVHDRAAVRAERALAACVEATERAERALTDHSRPPLPVLQAQLAAAVVELRAADDAAAGELWQAEIDPAELAAMEQRAYLLLARITGSQ
ncbi:FUSC family protein [Streptomyces sp. KLOTTS4A1]|uniref:FUSC family protein n=1 Tax=Streptomyces sp. KLOTTS4A1 TaxID=3390996 RepID=UPI0039F5F166